MAFIDTLTIADFKSYVALKGGFTFNTFDNWSSDASYNIGDYVGYSDYYVYCATQDNTGKKPNTNPSFWSKMLDYIFDEFITDAINSAQNLYHYGVFNRLNASIQREAGLLLVAHCLQNLQNTRNGKNESYIQPEGIVSSHSAGGASVSFVIPEKMLQDPSSMFLRVTHWGVSYYTLLMRHNFPIIASGGTKFNNDHYGSSGYNPFQY